LAAFLKRANCSGSSGLGTGFVIAFPYACGASSSTDFCGNP
jgi:hypothetical protein